MDEPNKRLMYTCIGRPTWNTLLTERHFYTLSIDKVNKVYIMPTISH